MLSAPFDALLPARAALLLLHLLLAVNALDPMPAHRLRLLWSIATPLAAVCNASYEQEEEKPLCHEGYAEGLCTRRRGSRENGCDGAACEVPSLQQRLRAVGLRTDVGKQKASAPDGKPTQPSCSAAAAATMRLAGVRDGEDGCPIFRRLRK